MPRAQRSGQGYRRTKLTAAGMAAALAATMFIGTGTGTAAPDVPAVSAQAASVAGAADAQAQAYKVNPRAGQLSAAIGFGISLADFQGQVGRAESRAIDLGIIGSLLAAPGCTSGSLPRTRDGDPTLPAEDQPQFVRAEARGAPASADGEEAGVMTQHAEATPDPSSRAVSTTAGREIIPGVLTIGPTRTESYTRYVDGVREAVAISEVAGLTLAGVVSLTGLRWEAIHRSGAVNEVTGTFTIASGSQRSGTDLLGPILGRVLDPILGPGGALPVDPVTLLNTIGDVLRPLGLSIVMPRAHEAGGVMFVEPMKVGFVPSEIRDTILVEILNLAQPVREPLIDALFDLECVMEDVTTVVDIAVGAFTGAGDFHLELGGVQAMSRELRESCFLCGTGSSGGGAVSLPPIPGTSGTPGIPGTPGVPASQTPAANTAAPEAPAPDSGATTRRAEPISEKGKRGGAMALVGAIGLGLLAAAAEADRRKMRRAQRMIPVEAFAHG